MGREYVPIFFDLIEVTEDLSDEQCGHLIRTVVLYARGSISAEDALNTLDGMERVAFRFLKGQVDRNAAISDARGKAASKKQTETNENKFEQNETNENKVEQTETKSPKEEEKEKEKENKNKNKKQKDDPRDGFDRFWSEYPKKVDKARAIRAFSKLAPDDALLDVMVAAIAKQRASPQWTKDGGEFIPNPATWLNGRRWEDEMPSPRTARGKPVAAQMYDQRDYSGKDQELLDRFVSTSLQMEA